MSKPHTPLFSIIVPIYKTEKYLCQCVDSILNQRFGNFEVILVDDGSPDGSGAICDSYAAGDARVKVIHKKNGGLVSARKAGLAACGGQYVVNVDSDDYIGEDHLERLAAVIENYHPQAVLFGTTQFSNHWQAVLKGKLPEGLYKGEKLETFRENLICDESGEQTILYNLCAAALSRDIYLPHQNAVPDDISRGEDLVVTTPLLAQCEEVFILDYCGYYYRSNPTSIMNTFHRNEPDQIKQVAAYMQATLPEQYRAKIDMYVSAHYFEFLDRAMMSMNYREYRQLIRETLDETLFAYLHRARCKGNPKVWLIFTLLRWQCFGALWLLRKIKKRQE